MSLVKLSQSDGQGKFMDCTVLKGWCLWEGLKWKSISCTTAVISNEDVNQYFPFNWVNLYHLKRIKVKFTFNGKLCFS